MAGYDVIPDLSSQGIYVYGSPQWKAAQESAAANNPFNMMMSSAQSGGAGNLSQIPSPDMGSFSYNSASQNYPTYMRSMGENQAQQAFQHNVNAGIRMGSSAQGFARAEDARNQARLGYQSQAGQQELGIQQALALEQQRRNDEQLKKYGLDISQRGQNLDYMSNLMRMMSGGGGGGGMKMGGTSSGHTTFTPGVSLLDTQNRDFAGMNQGGNDYSGYHNFGSSQPAYQPPVYGYSSGGGGSSNQFYSGMGGNQVQESGGRVSTYY